MEMGFQLRAKRDLPPEGDRMYAHPFWWAVLAGTEGKEREAMIWTVHEMLRWTSIMHLKAWEGFVRADVEAISLVLFEGLTNKEAGIRCGVSSARVGKTLVQAREFVLENLYNRERKRRMKKELAEYRLRLSGGSSQKDI